MSGKVKYEDLILDAIDQLRHRKARPDAERIYNSLFRRHQINCNDAKIALEKCVESGVVLRVAYKGNISYRNAAKKFHHLNRRDKDAAGRVQATKPRRKFAALLANAFAELVILEPDYLELGVPSEELIKTILSKDRVRYTKTYISILLEKEVDSGNLVRMENGNYLVGPNEPDRCQNGGENSNENNKLILTSANKFKKKTGTKPYKKERFMESLRNDERRNENLRVGGRRKRAKKVFDPSDNNLPKKRGRPIGSIGTKNGNDKVLSRHSDSDSRPESRQSQNGKEHSGVCSVCHNRNKKGPNDKMISCRECLNKAHESCLNGDDMMLKMHPDNTWQCPHCKTCVVCYETSDAGELVVCSICADCYHMGCHQPKLTDKLKKDAKWFCANCQMPEQLAVDNIQIGFNLDAVKIEDQHHPASPELSRNTTPTNNISLPPSPTPPTLSPQTTLNGQQHSPNDSDSRSIKEEELEENVDPSIPDATNWTSEDVYQYFVRYFPDEAIVFKDQEIDGHSLLLMKRMDVLKGLALKLGPALKIYRHVLKLQYRRDDPKLYWV